ncbi:MULTISPECIES: hypothetical protein [Exiguobacterium]|uniref:Uncharacterized protein n=1 Tax=Exiguobacterium sp. (strain ATCC BAA-1283 / AT1b) TaxID=360911 RepID=C4L2Z4_EXISA|nr:MULTISPECIES: hypothetical protein [unclassified Exiguobacterium]ACQ71268.1 hypothetical protein EAT1b_2346 [Exiguobacterium sp. AT1b]
MKRMWNVAALGAVIVIGLGTFAVDATEPKAEWALDISSNPSVWEDAVVGVSYSTENDIEQRFEVTTDESHITSNLNYIAEGLRYRERLNEGERAIHRQMNGMTYAESIRTEDGYIGVGQDGMKELIMFKQEDGEKLSTFSFDASDSKIYDIVNGVWSGVFLNDGQLNLIYRDGYDGGEDVKTMLATFNQAMNEVTVKELSMDKGFITHVINTNRLYNTDVPSQVTETRYIPVGVSSYEVIREGEEEINVENPNPGLFAYDTKMGKVVQLAEDQGFWDYTVSDHNLFALNEDGEEVVIDLNTGKQMTRKVLDSVDDAFYSNGRLYQTRQAKDGVVIDVYEDGKQISSAAITPENEDARDMLKQINVYVR